MQKSFSRLSSCKLQSKAAVIPEACWHKCVWQRADDVGEPRKLPFMQSLGMQLPFAKGQQYYFNSKINMSNFSSGSANISNIVKLNINDAF